MNNTTLPLTNNYDSVGAIVFIVVVLLWYSLSFVFLLGIQMIKSTETVEESVRHSRKLFTHSFRERSNNKKILEELGDKTKRDKLWDIYLGTSRDANERINHAEISRIQNIQRQLATINEHHRDDDDQRIQFIEIDDSRDFDIGSSVPNISEPESRFRPRRQSSVDLQILEEWKTSYDGLKVHANWPSIVQKLMIRRHLRRQRLGKDYRSLRKQSVP